MDKGAALIHYPLSIILYPLHILHGCQAVKSHYLFDIGTNGVAPDQVALAHQVQPVVGQVGA